MKKITALISALVLTISAATAISANAAPNPMTYIPSVTIKALPSENFRISNDGSVIINKRKIKDNSDFVFQASIYIHDESLSARVVTPKWKSSTPLLELDNVINVNKPAVEYAYAQKNDSGDFVARYTVIVSNDKNYNTMALSCVSASMMGDTSSLEPYGEASDSYPLTTFDVKVSKDIPEGDQKIYFLTASEDYDTQQITEVYLNTDNGDRKLIPETNNLNVFVVDYELGDVDNDGSITSSDATEALIAYSELSVGNENPLTRSQQFAADINGDGQVNSSDATDILSYYSYLSTISGNPVSIEEYTNT